MKKSVLYLIFLFCSITGKSQNYVPDSSFNSTGVKTFTFFNNIDRAYGSVVQADQKIVIVGLSKNTSTNFFELCFARFNPNGTLDNTFGTSGTTKVTMGNQSSIGGMTPRIAIDPVTGKFVAVNSGRAASQDFMVCRLDTAGHLDLSFHSTGYFFVDILGSNTQPDAANALAIDSNSNIYVAGVVGVSPPLDNEFAVIKVTAAGQLDPSFDTDGKAIYNPTSGNEFAKAILIQPDGKILVAGSAGANTGLFRIDSTGVLDTGFGTGGNLSLALSNSSDNMGLALDSLDRIVVSTTTSTNFNGVARILPNGTLDASFGTSGTTTFKINNKNSSNCGLQIVSGNKMVMVGSVGNSTGFYDYYICRLDSTGALDLSFNNTGFETKLSAPTAIEDDANSFSILADGRIFVCGTAVYSSAVNEDIGMMMFKPVVATTGISDIASPASMAVYPNPFTKDLMIDCKFDHQFRVVDIAGKTVFQDYLLKGYHQINLEGLSPGIYFLQGSDNSHAIQIVKE